MFILCTHFLWYFQRLWSTSRFSF